VNQVELYEQANLLINRLERISVDSIWARRASGIRGALLKWVERSGKPGDQLDDLELQRLSSQIKSGFRILEQAARERFP
jgi:hypothetical protein